MTTDQRIAYGFSCSWWDSIQKVGSVDAGKGVKLPCCPHCGGMLMEVPTIEEWNHNVEQYEKQGNPGYGAMINLGRGKCFPTITALKAAYEQDRRPA